MRIFHRFATAMLAALLSFAAAHSASAEKMKVGFIYIGPPGDHGWTYAHDQGRLQLEEEPVSYTHLTLPTSDLV